MNSATKAVLQAIPETLQADLASHWQSYVAAAQAAGCTPPQDTNFLRKLGQVWTGSQFVAQACGREPQLLEDLLASGDLLSDYAVGELTAKVRLALAGASDDADLAIALRRLRRREMVRIAWRDLAGWARVEEVLEDLSALADACVSVTLERLMDWQCREAGIPKTAVWCCS